MLDRSNRDCLLQELRNAGAEVFNDHRIRCFAHEDKNPSGSIHQGEDGVWRFHCFAGSCGFKGDVFDVLARAENKPLKDVLKENNPQSMVNLRAEKAPPKTYESIEAIQAIVPGTLEGRYSYTNPQTKQADLVVLRFRQGGKKQFWQCSRRAAGWVLQRPPGLLPLYNRMELAGSPRRVVVVVEGEKCVHAVRAAGQVGTTSPMGAGKASYADWTPLAGKTCYLWPDHDEGGIKHMQEVEGILERLNPPCRLYWIDPAGLNLPPKGDVADFTAGKEKDLAHAALESVLDTATALGAARELSDLMEDTISGKRSAGSWPWSYVTSQSKALLPGTVTIFCGSPGVSKSFAILQALRHWHSIGVRAAVFELEEDRAYHLNRLLAQECEQADLLDPDWVKAHPDDVRRKMQEQAGLLNEIGRMIYSAPETQVDYKALVDWTESRAKEGYRVIVIDPVTAVSPQRDVWVADSEFMFRIKTLARVQQCSILLVTHPRKGAKGGGSMDDLAGGSAFQRFSQTVLWLEFLKVPKAYTVQTVCGSATITCNRVLHLFKCRNGRGTGSAIAMHWSGESLKLAEQGMIVAEKRKSRANALGRGGDGAGRGIGALVEGIFFLTPACFRGRGFGMEESLVPTPLLPGPVAPEVREEVPIDRSAGEYLDPLGRVRGTEVERLCRGPHQQGGRGHKVARVRPGGTDAPLDLQGNRLCNPIERRFVDYWVRTGDPLKAVQFAGYLAHSRSKQSLHKQIYHKMRTLRSRAHVMAYYRQRLDRLSARFSTTTAAIIGRHVVRAQATILDCLVPKEDGSGYEVAADLSRLTPQQAATIKKLRHEERVTQEGDTVHTTVVELHDAHAADVELGKIFGVYERRGPEEQVAGPVRLPATVADADRMIAEIQEHKNRLLALAEQAQRMTPVFAGRGILEAQVTGERPA